MALDLLYFSKAECTRRQAMADELLLPEINKTEQIFSALGVHGIANQWLLNMAWKRPLALIMMGDLLETTKGPSRKILEVGGSLSCLTLALSSKHDYTLVEKVTHEKEEDYRRIEAHIGKPFIYTSDWNVFDFKDRYDLILANDVFPNVDQRLYEFVEKVLPMTQELRLSLTYYENTSWEVQRISSGEQLMIRPWGLRELSMFFDFLETTYPQWCSTMDRSQLQYNDYSNDLFSNKRNVIYMRIKK